MQSVRGIHLALSAGARVGACAPAATTVAGGARRAAGGGPFAAFKVKKSNWVESNEVMRENQFYTWTLNRRNVVGVAVMALAFPLAFHYLNKSELERRDVAYRGFTKPRDYL